MNDTRTKVTVKLIPRIDLQALAAKFVIYIHLFFSASSFLFPTVHLFAFMMPVSVIAILYLCHVINA